jgi:hypothetical protein
VGDDGAVLVYMVAGKVEGRFYFNNVTAPEIEKVFLGDTEARVYVLVDVSDQSYLQHSLPPVSAMNVSKMVARRLEKEFDRTDIKGALPLGRSTTGRKDWNFLFLSVRNVAPLSDWLELIAELPNELVGIYLLPIETEPLVKAIKKAVATENVAQASEWQMLVTHNKTGGLRQVVYRNGRLLFTRLAQPVGGNAPGVIAGHIEQEILSTMEYIRRMAFDEKAGMDIFIITASEVKKQLESTRLKVANSYVLTPHEVAGQLGLVNATEPRDKFADVVILAQFGKGKKPILRLSTTLIEHTRKMVIGKLALQIFGAALIPISVLLVIFNIYTSVVTYIKTGEEQEKLTRVQREQRELQQRADAQASRKAEVEAMVALYDQFSQDAIVPFQFLTKVGETKGPIALYTAMQIATSEGINPATKKQESEFTFIGTIDYPNRSPTLDAYLKEINAFAQSMRDAFKTQQVAFTGLPGQGDFKLSVEGGPTVAGSTAAAPANTLTKSTLQLTISGKITEDIRKAMFEMPRPEQKKPTPLPVQAPAKMMPTPAPLKPAIPVAPAAIAPVPAQPLVPKP